LPVAYCLLPEKTADCHCLLFPLPN